jgi:para-aminobenzoate synthetase
MMEREARMAHVRVLEREVDTEEIFVRLYGDREAAFWLDGARADRGLSRFSFLGDATEILSYRAGQYGVTVRRQGERPRREDGDIFEVLGSRLAGEVAGAEELPFDLHGGYVGYLGYELKSCAGARAPYRARTPDAIWLRAERFIAVDHRAGRTYLIALGDEGAGDWLRWAAEQLANMPDATLTPGIPIDVDPDVEPYLARDRRAYLDAIDECQRELRAGESYEICLTTQLTLPAPTDDLGYFRRLRRTNPAPYAAFLRADGVSVASSSPERFLRVDDDRFAESKPIKGTVPRSDDPRVDEKLRRSLQEDPKSRAENLMIVDLLRNDLGRVCEIGSVHVPSFMATESYTTVHQLVSTVRGRLRDGVSAVDCARACFPAGSMTGAPKLRTMEIIDRLEGAARGVYSGALGFFSFSGAADLSVVIRTAVIAGGQLTVGAGGAIVLDSDSQAEYDEMILKARASLRAYPWGESVDA